MQLPRMSIQTALLRGCDGDRCVSRDACRFAAAAGERLLADGGQRRAGVIASGSIFRWMIDGLPDACAAAKAAGKSAVFSTSAPIAAERLRIGDEIRIVQRGGDDAAGIFALLVHADGAVQAVVGEHHDHRQFVLHGGGEILPGHQEIAVAGDAHHGALGVQSFIASAAGKP